MFRAKAHLVANAGGTLCLVYRGDTVFGPGDPRRDQWFHHRCPWLHRHDPVGPFATLAEALRAVGASATSIALVTSASGPGAVAGPVEASRSMATANEDT